MLWKPTLPLPLSLVCSKTRKPGSSASVTELMAVPGPPPLPIFDLLELPWAEGMMFYYLPKKYSVWFKAGTRE